jgi:hypothetical protein
VLEFYFILYITIRNNKFVEFNVIDDKKIFGFDMSACICGTYFIILYSVCIFIEHLV